MNIIKVKNHEELSSKAAHFIAGQMIRKPASVLGLATGSTPIKTYQNLIKMYQGGILDFSQIKSFNLDEYCGLERSNDQSYYYFMMENLFKHVNIDINQVHVPRGICDDIENEGAAYDEKIRAAGGVDLQLLGIGNNGHIGFNEPADQLVYGTHVEQLTQSTIDANARFFDKIEDVPTSAISMGIGTIMEAKAILLIGSDGKQDIIEQTIYGPVTPKVPASMLRLHPDVTIIYVA